MSTKPTTKKRRGSIKSRKNSVSAENTRASNKERRKLFKKCCLNVEFCKYPVIPAAAKLLNWRVTSDMNVNWDVLWSDSGWGISRWIKEAKRYQRVNHFPGMVQIYRKGHLARAMAKMQQCSESYDFWPQTWVLPRDYGGVLNYFKQSNSTKTIAIVKPCAGAQGKGIYLALNPKSIDPTADSIVQNYISNPLLIDGKKFDLRIYVLIVSCDPLRVYIYKEGLVRLCVEEYKCPSKNNVDNQFMHLTNYSVNKKSENFVKNDGIVDESECNKRSLTWLMEWLNKNNDSNGNGNSKRESRSDICWKNISEIVVKTLISIQAHLSESYRSFKHDADDRSPFTCFEILGFDILLTSTLHPYLLEVNHAPSFRTDTHLDARIKLGLMEDTLRLLNVNGDDRIKYASQAAKLSQVRLYGSTFAGDTPKFLNEDSDTDLWVKYLRNEKRNMGNFQLIYPTNCYPDQPTAGKQRYFDHLLGIASQLFRAGVGSGSGPLTTAVNDEKTAFALAQLAHPARAGERSERRSPRYARATTATGSFRYRSTSVDSYIQAQRRVFINNHNNQNQNHNPNRDSTDSQKNGDRDDRMYTGGAGDIYRKADLQMNIQPVDRAADGVSRREVHPMDPVAARWDDIDDVTINDRHGISANTSRVALPSRPKSASATFAQSPRHRGASSTGAGVSIGQMHSHNTIIESDTSNNKPGIGPRTNESDTADIKQYVSEFRNAAAINKDQENEDQERQIFSYGRGRGILRPRPKSQGTSRNYRTTDANTNESGNRGTYNDSYNNVERRLFDNNKGVGGGEIADNGLPDSGLGEDEADTGMFMSVSSENAVIIDLNNISPSPPTSNIPSPRGAPQGESGSNDDINQHKTGMNRSDPHREALLMSLQQMSIELGPECDKSKADKAARVVKANTTATETVGGTDHGPSSSPLSGKEINQEYLKQRKQHQVEEEEEEVVVVQVQSSSITTATSRVSDHANSLRDEGLETNEGSTNNNNSNNHCHNHTDNRVGECANRLGDPGDNRPVPSTSPVTLPTNANPTSISSSSKSSENDDIQHKASDIDRVTEIQMPIPVAPTSPPRSKNGMRMRPRVSKMQTTSNDDNNDQQQQQQQRPRSAGWMRWFTGNKNNKKEKEREQQMNSTVEENIHTSSGSSVPCDTNTSYSSASYDTTIQDVDMERRTDNTNRRENTSSSFLVKDLSKSQDYGTQQQHQPHGQSHSHSRASRLRARNLQQAHVQHKRPEEIHRESKVSSSAPARTWDPYTLQSQQQYSAECSPQSDTSGNSNSNLDHDRQSFEHEKQQQQQQQQHCSVSPDHNLMQVHGHSLNSPLTHEEKELELLRAQYKEYKAKYIEYYNEFFQT